MFGIGMPELILILAVALVVIGPKKLPDLAKSLGKAMGEFKKATNDIKDSMQLDSGIQDVKTSFKDLEKELKAPAETPESSDSGGDATASEATVATEEAADSAVSDTAVADSAVSDTTVSDSDVSDAGMSDADDAKTPTT